MREYLHAGLLLATVVPFENVVTRLVTLAVPPFWNWRHFGSYCDESHLDSMGSRRMKNIRASRPSSTDRPAVEQTNNDFLDDGQGYQQHEVGERLLQRRPDQRPARGKLAELHGLADQHEFGKD